MINRFQKILTLLLILSFSVAYSQMDNMGGMHDHMHMTHDTMKSMDMEQAEMPMHSFFSLYLPMTRDGSGTSWQPDQSPMMMYMQMHKNTMFMAHGNIFLRYTSQDAAHQGSRGAYAFDAPNWLMFMLAQRLGRHDLLSFHAMLSADILTEGGDGYPLLFQTGESYHDTALVDRQHPHDLFSELAINYTHSFSKDIDINLYFGYPGEPALGPGVFMHRVSAMNNPDAPLGHHWQDATHITFGVATLGFRYKMVKAEGSIFTGREPDENRVNFDRMRFDSYSYRISANPDKHFAIQFSQGFIKSPEKLEPAINIIRTTASVMHVYQFKNESFIASTLAWGMNHSSLKENLHSVLLESNLKLKPLTVYMRYEWIEKDPHELQLFQFPEELFNIHAFTLGLNRRLVTLANTDLSIGMQGTVNVTGKSLQQLYGQAPVSAELFFRISPTLFKGHH